jgi:hypothetical protein
MKYKSNRKTMLIIGTVLSGRRSRDALTWLPVTLANDFVFGFNISSKVTS